MGHCGGVTKSGTRWQGSIDQITALGSIWLVAKLYRPTGHGTFTNNPPLAVSPALPLEIRSRGAINWLRDKAEELSL